MLVTYRKNGYDLDYADFIKFHEKKTQVDPTPDMPAAASDPGLYDSWSAYHQLWLDTLDTYESLQKALGTASDETPDTRYGQYNLALKKRDDIQAKRTALAQSVQKEAFGFTPEELDLLHKIYNVTDYVDSSLSVLWTDDTVSIIDTQEQLYQNAMEELSIQSQPRITYSTTQDNFLALEEYREFASALRGIPHCRFHGIQGSNAEGSSCTA